jgi:hypothetical protein
MTEPNQPFAGPDCDRRRDLPRIPEGLALSIAIWTSVGSALGIAMRNMALWIPAGATIGLTLWITGNKAK